MTPACGALSSGVRRRCKLRTIAYRTENMDTKAILRRYVKAERARRARQAKLERADVEDLSLSDTPRSLNKNRRNEDAFDTEERSIAAFLRKLDIATANYVEVDTEGKIVFVDLGEGQDGTAEFRIAHPAAGVLSFESSDKLCHPDNVREARSFATFKDGVTYLKTGFLEDLARHIAVAETMIEEPARRRMTDGITDGGAWIASATWRRRYRFYRDVLGENFGTTFKVEEGKSFDPINDPRVEDLVEAIGGIDLDFWDDTDCSRYDPFGVEFDLQFRHLPEQYFVGFLTGAKEALEGLWESRRDKKYDDWTYSIESEE